MFGIELLNEGTLIAQHGLLQLFYCFLFGLLTSITPCVYPLIPITLSIFGATEQQSRARSFWLSLCYVMGIALTYTILGSLSASTGALFGAHLGSFWVLIPVSLVLLIIALNTLEVLHGSYVSKFQTMASRVGGKGASGAFVMGTVSGVVAAPCVGPFLAVLLVVAASTASASWGALLFFFYALGLGVPFLILGTFSGLINRIPRSGNWLLLVKFVLAVLLFDVILFLLQAKVSFDWLAAISEFRIVPLIIFALCLYAAYYALINERTVQKLFLAIICSLSAFSLYVAPHDVSEGSTASVWLKSSVAGIEVAKERNTITMVDVFADWCAACKELEAITFPHPEVKKTLSDFVLVRANYEDESDFIEKYGIVGLPAVLFINHNGEEIDGSRINGFLNPDNFVDHVNKTVKKP